MFLMLIALTLFGVLMFETTTKFNASKIVLQLSTEEVPVGDIPFPAVTICPQIFYKVDLRYFNGTLSPPLDDKCACAIK
jgi:Amiloride-sensitive sodium channel